MQNQDFGQHISQAICILNYKDFYCFFTKTTLSKVIQKWHVLMLTLTKIFQNHHCKNICSHLILVLQRFARIFQHLIVFIKSLSHQKLERKKTKTISIVFIIFNKSSYLSSLIIFFE